MYGVPCAPFAPQWAAGSSQWAAISCGVVAVHVLLPCYSRPNKLSAEKSAELVYIFSNLRLLRKITAGDRVEFFYAWRKTETRAPLQVLTSRVHHWLKHWMWAFVMSLVRKTVSHRAN